MSRIADSLQEAVTMAQLQARAEKAEAERDELRAENANLFDAFNPRMWTPSMSFAWHRAIPDVQRAFEDLLAAALTTTPEDEWSAEAIKRLHSTNTYEPRECRVCADPMRAYVRIINDEWLCAGCGKPIPAPSLTTKDEERA